MPVSVQGPDGLQYQFPDGTDKAAAIAYFRKKGIGGNPAAPAPRAADEMRAIPRWSDPGGVAYHLRNLRNRVIDQLPAAGGFAGGLIGAGAGAESGPGAIGTAAVGAGAGGALGEAARQQIMEELYPKAPKMGNLESGARILEEGGLQSLNELGGQVGGRLAGKAIRPLGNFVPDTAFAKYPFLKSVFAAGEGASPQAAQHLTAAAANKQQAGVALEAIDKTLDDIQQEMTKLPPGDRTVKGFLGAVNARKDAMNTESGAALLPIAGQKTVPTGIADAVRNLKRSYMPNTPEGRSQAKYLANRAVEFDKPWSFRQLDELRTDLSSQLAKHKAKGAVAKYAAQKGDLDLAIDNAILDGLRDTVYPQMDRAAGKPSGYFESLKGRQASLITLQELLERRVRDLSGSQAISEVAPRFGSENISASAHPGSPIRFGAYGIRQALAPKRELNAASKHVARAFPAVNSLPYRVLFSAGIRGAEIPPAPRQNPTDEWAGTQP